MKETQNQYCSVKEVVQRKFDPSLDPFRVSLIQSNDLKWVNGTVLHYYFFTDFDNAEWSGNKTQIDIVRNAFKLWSDVGIGIRFVEVSDIVKSELRIGFERGDGSWSYVGRQVLNVSARERTMNFGWDLRQSEDTALHEIGHALGMPHEHQNPIAGISWDEEKVYEQLGQAPNNWSRETTYYNIIRKISPDSVSGSEWDPNSIMHYPFGAGLIKSPEKYSTGLSPAPGLSERDIKWVKTFYPKEQDLSDFIQARTFHKLTIGIGEQRDLRFVPPVSTYYTVATYGNSDTVLVIFEETSAGLVFVGADDDSGEAYNARKSLYLKEGVCYVIKVRLYWKSETDTVGVYINY